MADNDVTRIAGNIGAMNALYSLTNINKQLSIHSTRLSTGKRINSAADDPAGLAISTKMMGRSEGLKVALSNIGDAKNLLAVAESGMGRLNDILIQMRGITENAANDTNGTDERAIVKEQLASYAAQINDIVAQTKWSDKKLISGDYSSAANALTFQTGVDNGETTKLDGLVDLSAGVDGLKLLNAVAPTAASSPLTDINGAAKASVASDFISTTVNSTVYANRPEIANGTYKVTVDIIPQGTYVADPPAAETYKARISLRDADDNIVKVDADGAEATGGLADYQEVDYTNATQLVNLGIGISVNLKADLNDSITGVTMSSPDQYTTYSKAVASTSAGTVALESEDAAGFGKYMDTIDAAMKLVNSQLSKIGSLTGSLTFKEDQVSSSQINIEASYNRIMNANMAEEQVNASKLMILQQTSTAMLAQANAAPQFLLSLFK